MSDQTNISRKDNNEVAGFDLIVIGGGAAGFYGAIQAAEMISALKILIVEKSNKLLSKVRVSGGGRCNVTHHCFDPIKLSRHYPRGEKALKRAFKEYSASDTVSWFASKKVQLKAEEDGRMFPVTDTSSTVIDCLLSEARRLKIRIENDFEVTRLEQDGRGFSVTSQSGKRYLSRQVLVTTGGSPKPQAYSFIKALGHTIRGPIPSLFTFNDSSRSFSELMGVSVAKAEVRIRKTSFRALGPLLITHWGLSGPAVIKLSAWAAEYLHQANYEFLVFVNWTGTAQEEDVRNILLSQKISRMKQKILSNPLFELPQRLWVKLCYLADIPEDRVWGDVSHRHLNRLVEHLINCSFNIKGKTTFKEEFVTCGGVDLKEVDLETMESKMQKGLFFAGEVLDIDGETGGFNFQAAWTTAFLAAKGICSSSPKVG